MSKAKKKSVLPKTLPGRLCSSQSVADPGFESRGGGGGGGRGQSKTPKLVIATRSRRGPALAPSRGSGGMLLREILKIGMRRYAFSLFWGIISEKSESEFAR